MIDANLYGSTAERAVRSRRLAEVRGLQAFLWFMCAYYGAGVWR